MKSLLGITLTLASISWATPLSITGYTYSYGIHVNGDHGFTFNWTPNLTGFYYGCDEAWGPCDPSGRLATGLFTGQSFLVSDGSTSVSIDSYGQGSGAVAFEVKWIAKPFYLDTVSEPLVVPVTVFGTLKAWTAEELASNSTPFFNYSIRGRGTMPASNVYHGGRPRRFEGDDPNRIVAADWPSGFVYFTGTAEAVPEPASWILALSAGVVLLRRFGRSCPEHNG